MRFVHNAVFVNYSLRRFHLRVLPTGRAREGVACAVGGHGHGSYVTLCANAGVSECANASTRTSRLSSRVNKDSESDENAEDADKDRNGKVD